MALLLVVVAGGLYGYVDQLRHGLIVTAMTDHVSWGAYIANFTFVVGLTDAAVMVIIPGFLFQRRPLRDLVWPAMYLALAAVVMALLFVVADLGRPERGWHLAPYLGVLNFPTSMLSWDVVVLMAFFAVLAGLVLWMLYSWSRDRDVPPRSFVPWLVLAMTSAVVVHTITAFLYTWMGARPFWNSAIVAPRFLASAFVVGPVFLILSVQVIRRTMAFAFDDEVLHTLRRIVAVAMLVNLFLLGAELFREFKTESAHMSSAVYLYFGLGERRLLVPYIWTAVVFNVSAAVVFLSPRLAARRWLLNAACLLAFVGIWIEKGMGLIVPGFLPSPLGEVVEYTPSVSEVLVCAGIWAIGMLVFTVLLKVGVPLELRARATRGAGREEGAG